MVSKNNATRRAMLKKYEYYLGKYYAMAIKF